MRTTNNTIRHSRLSSSAGRLAAISAASIFILSCASFCNTALADQTTQAAADQSKAGSPKLRLRIAVDQAKWNEIRDDVSLPRDVKEGLQAQLVERLQQSGHFQVMEREATSEEAAKHEDNIDQEKRDAVPEDSAVGGTRPRQRRTAAEYLITPTITGLQQTSHGRGKVVFGPVTLGGKEVQTTLSINIRISDAETSETVDSFTAEGKVTEKAQEFSIEVGGSSAGAGGARETPISKVVGLTLDDAVTKICSRLAKEPWYALVAAQDPTTRRVIIAAGSVSGVEIGMEFDVSQPGAIIRNPETGDIISHGDETPVGRIRIVRVERRAAYAEVVRGEGFKVGDVVREIR